VIYILSGQDDFSIAKALDEIKRGIGNEETLAMSTTSLEGQQLSLEELKNACETMPFMMGKRLVIVEGLLGRFETGGRSRRSSRSGGKNKKQEDADAFSRYLGSGIPETTVLVLTEGIISGDNPVFKEISKKATVRSFSLPREAELREWVQKRVKEEGGTITAGAVQLLARLVGSNLWVMENEITKLILYTDGRRIEEEDIRALVGYNQQATVFTMIDAILESRADRAEQMLQQQFLDGVAPAFLLFMLNRQVQLIVRAKELTGRRMNNREMQGKLGITEWVLKKTLEQASRYSMPRLREVYQDLLDTDIAIKTGKYNPELALNILVAELCRHSGPRLARTGARR
jgi:DNA polymerase-3 subunit delta